MKDGIKKRLRVAVLYGGRSGEHEVSLQSAASVIRNLDSNRFEVIPVAIDKSGRWLFHNLNQIEQNSKSLPVHLDAPQVVLSSFQSGQPGQPGQSGGEPSLMQLSSQGAFVQPVDVVFPVIHGPLCEDGTIQGLLEIADVPYVGCGVLSSAVGMDKDVAKRMIRDAGLPIVPYVAVKTDAWKKSPVVVVDKIQRELGFPVFVKPANQGSSVGVHKVKDPSGLSTALDDAFRYDVKVLVEKAIQAREIEISVLENLSDGLQPLVSVPGEIAPSHEFYSYEAKYLDENGATLMIPADLSAENRVMAQKIAFEAFLALECEGMARVDLFLDKNSGQFYFNEVNTIPGFTSISMYPKLWEATQLKYPELLSRLIDLALMRHSRKKALLREFVLN